MRVPAPLLAIASLAGTGCVASVAGDWDGTVDCGVGSVEMHLDIVEKETGARRYDGDGNIQGFTIGGVESAIQFEMDIDQPEMRGPQVLDLQTTCALLQADAAPSKVDCYQFDELAWDGADLLTAEVFDFLGEYEACDIELVR